MIIKTLCFINNFIARWIAKHDTISKRNLSYIVCWQNFDASRYKFPFEFSFMSKTQQKYVEEEAQKLCQTAWEDGRTALIHELKGTSVKVEVTEL